jgi:hypothetical protein
MMSLIIGLGVILVLIILYQIFKVANLVSIAKGKKSGSNSKALSAVSKHPVFWI